MNYLWLLLAFGVACLATGVLATGALARLAMDVPNQRSLHVAPIPRTGGLAVFFTVLLVWGIGGYAAQYPALVAATAVFLALSFADDMKGLAVFWRLLCHASVSALYVYDCCRQIGPFVLVMVLLGMVWMTNLYNFMDGSDGLAGGMALFGFSAYAAAAHAVPLGAMSLVVAAAAAGFLVFNFPPAKVFMGDAGSIPLGFLAASLGLLGWRQGLWPLWFPFLVFSPFVVDASVTLLRRLAGGERVWQAHREHYYQRLIRMGWGHRRTALAEYALMAAAAGSALAGRSAVPAVQALLLALWCAVYLGLMAAVDRRWRRFVQTSGAGR